LSSKPFYLGTQSHVESEILVFPDPETVFAHKGLYLYQDFEDEDAEEESDFLCLVATIVVPLKILNPEYKGFGYYLYQEEVSIDGLYYITNENGKIETCKAFKYNNYQIEFGKTYYDGTYHKYHYGLDSLTSVEDFEEEYQFETKKKMRGQYVALDAFSYDKSLTNFSPQYDENSVYNEAYDNWKVAFFENFKFPERAYDNPGILCLGLYPLWIQNGWFFPKDRNGKRMEYIGDSDYFALGVKPIYPYLFFSPDTNEFVQINQMT
jgi:hypothetical protein